ncbi:MAG: tyrosine-type recombinase/integrase [Dehalococcoidia bacterium]
MGVTDGTMRFYREKLQRYFTSVDYLKATKQDIERYLAGIPANKYGLGNRNSHFRAVRTFHKWLESEYSIPSPVEGMTPPKLTKSVFPTLDITEIEYLIQASENVRDKAIISLFVESGLRLAELAAIKTSDINWKERLIKVRCKGQKDTWATYGESTESFLKQWLKEYDPKANKANECIWNLSYWGITQMLKRLEKKTDIKCNPHVFRRSFASILRKKGLDSLMIRDLGRWQSVEMVSRYTRAVDFGDTMKLYKAPLG